MNAITSRGLPTASADPPAIHSDLQQPPKWSFVVAFVACLAAIGFVIRDVFLFTDDYAFLGQAARMPFDWTYLAADLFAHFSPVSRLVNAPMVVLLEQNPGLLFWALLAMVAGVQAAVFLLMRILFGRSWYALAGGVLLGTSLTLAPLANWWTAGLNILPAMAGSALCLAGAVRVVQGHSRWWGVLAISAYLIAVLDYELTMLMAGYVALWVVLFRTRMTNELLAPLVMRTWWLWASLIFIGGTSLVNYRLNYYVPFPSASLPDYAAAMAMALLENGIPAILGFHDPDTVWFTVLGTVLGLIVLLAVLVWTNIRSRDAWRGWLFAAAGWGVPAAAYVLNRVGMYGITRVMLPFYFFFPTMLMVIGIIAALTCSPRPSHSHYDGTYVSLGGREPSSKHRRPPRLRQVTRLTVSVSVMIVAVAWFHSVGPSARSVQVFGAADRQIDPPTPGYVQEMRSSAIQVSADVGAFTVLNADVPEQLVYRIFGPYNRADWVAQLNAVPLDFDQVGRPTYVIANDGTLTPAPIDWRHELAVVAGTEPGLSIAGASDLRAEPGRGVCFVATDSTTVGWTLPAPVTGDRIVVRSLVTVDRPTTERLVILPQDSQSFEVANYDNKAWQPELSGILDTVMSSSVATISFDSLTPGATVCLSDIAIGVVDSN